MNLVEYTILAASSLFVIVDPVATVPAFLAMTSEDSVSHRLRTARLACTVMAIILLVFAVGGAWIFRILGITMPAFQLAASIVLLLVALDMLQAQRSRVHETSEETEAGASKQDVAITPLAIPMLAGPGAISTVIVLQAKAADLIQVVALHGCIVLVALASFIIFRLSVHGARWLNPIAMKITTRIMGLLLAALAIQFMLNAAAELMPGFFHSGAPGVEQGTQTNAVPSTTRS
ncbi:MAG TPA: NAAT family transporter [Verrucomicrobia bacterium]|nr:NAAT family transporter [Verrucomicrobiota bacterium]HOB31926.1 MarC family protein [Verrucomicrobiota bacterium]HOP96172.1 MarC family protein [Verrucomicrobiota bacterium]